MSGVCAIVARPLATVDARELDAMVAAAPHRSTGGQGRHLGDGVGLAQLRRATGRFQPAAPAVDQRTGTVVVADARIDNAPELRAALGTDAPEPDQPDGVLIAAAYARWGMMFLPKLLGDFAFVLWDPRSRRAVLARDPMAMRALYYRVESDRLLAATEISQLLAVPGVPDDPDERMVAAYLAGCFGPLDWTWYRGISQVAPSHAVIIEDGVVRTWRYWDVDPEHGIVYRSAHEYAEQLRDLYLDAVRVRMRGDRPVGVLLSGGVDSGAAAAAMGWLHEREGLAPELRSYSFDYGALTACDERHISRHIVDRYEIQASDVFAEDAGPLAGYPAHAPDIDDPFHGHFQPLLDQTFARASSHGVGPLFTGMRGDLAVGPIDVDYTSLLRARRWADLAMEVRLHATEDPGTITSLARYLWPILASTARRRSVAGWLRRLAASPLHRRAGGGQGVPPWVNGDLVRRVDLPAIVAAHAEGTAPPLRGALRRRRYQWIFAPMHLRWAVSHERRVAHYGMEAVDAWSDRRIAEFGIAVPQHVLDRPIDPDKRLARAAFRGVMPERFRQAATKTVPTPLFERTLRTTAAPAVRQLLTDSRAEAAGWFDAQLLHRHYEQVVAGGSVPDGLWWSLTVEWWLRCRELSQ